MNGTCDNDFDLVIAGGGMVGATLALALAESHLRIALVDQGSLQPEPLTPLSPYSPRVSALTEASVNLFKNLSVWEAMVADRVCPYRGMKVWDSHGTGAISFDARTVARESIGCIVENTVIRNALLSRLSAGSVSCYEGQGGIRFALEAEKSAVTLADGRHLQGRLLVAADGAQSALRQAADIPLSQTDYKHHAIVATVATADYHQDTAWQVFLDTGPLAFLPLPSLNQQHYCAIVWSLVPEAAQRVMAMDNQAFCQALEAAFEGRLGAVIDASPRFCYPLSQRHARRYYQGNVVLVGDAAHTIHPLAGQGVNLGLLDVAVLTEEVCRALRRQDDFAGAHILARYQRRRKAHNLAMMAAMTGLQNLFAADAMAVRWLRNTGLKWLDHWPVIKGTLIQQALGVYGADRPALVKPPQAMADAIGS